MNHSLACKACHALIPGPSLSRTLGKAGRCSAFQLGGADGDRTSGKRSCRPGQNPVWSLRRVPGRPQRPGLALHRYHFPVPHRGRGRLFPEIDG
jgi:hypothetical protein